MRIMIRFLILAIFAIMFSVSCSNSKLKDIAAPCHYSDLDKDSILYSLYLDEYKDKTQSDFKNLDENSLIVVYYTYHDGGSKESEHAIVLTSNENKHFSYKFNYKNEVKDRKEVSEKRGLNARKLIQNLLERDDRFINRYCSISGGAVGVFLIYNLRDDRLEYFYESEGYECDVLGENNKMYNVAELVKLMKKL